MIRDRVLLITEARPITPNGFGGGAAVVYSHLELLHHHGIEMHLLTLGTAKTTDDFNHFVSNQQETWAEVQSWLASYQHFDLYTPAPATGKSRFQNFMEIVGNPIGIFFPQVNATNLERLQTIAEQIQPGFVWAEHYLPTWLAIHAFPRMPIVYGHTDWEYKLASLRRQDDPKSGASLRKTLRQSLRAMQRKRLDTSVVRRVAAVASVSATEAEEARKLGAGQCWYLPPTYPLSDIAPVEGTLPQARIVHLGQMSTTASRLGLEDFLHYAWPEIAALPIDDRPELWVIGRMDGATAEMQALLDHNQAVCPGFVADLSQELRPYDIHIVPWRFNTGVRTRIPVALNHAQVVVTMRATAASLAELENGRNCFLVDDFAEMAAVVKQLLADEALRRRVGDAGRETFLSSYTQPGLQPHFDQCIDNFLQRE